MRTILLMGILLLAADAARAQARPTIDQEQLPPNYVPTGKQMFKQYCAPCHGLDAKGHGPTASSLKIPPADLTTLAKRNHGEFPYGLVSSVLKVGPGVSAHGSSDMPTWGMIFQYVDKNNQAIVQKRIGNLVNYVASLQRK
jgi:mono/diheme cytochrome c family protein